MAGGVAANKGLRNALTKAVKEELTDVELLVPPLALCGDNAAMIGAAAYVKFNRQEFSGYDLNAQPGLSFDNYNEK